MQTRTNAFVLAILAATSLRAEEPVDWEVVGRIREEGFRHSQVDSLVRQLCEGIGPRVTNSPQMRQASRWAQAKFESWGLQPSELHRFEFGSGWSYEHCAVHLRRPYDMQLEALPLAWTPGTVGPIRAKALLCKASSVEELETWLEAKRDVDLQGTVLFLDAARKVVIDDVKLFSRGDEASLNELCEYDIPGGQSGPDSVSRSRRMAMMRRRLYEVAPERGIVAFAHISSRDAGIVRATEGGDMNPLQRATIPGLALNAEHYNRILRELEKGEVELEIEIRAQFYDDDSMAENTLAEIRGGSKSRELVMAGAHLDSWHAATGATDNAAGCAVVMEAARILRAIDAKLARTIRFALWAGEEQGLLGSEAYVDQIFVKRPPVTDAGQLALARRYWEPTWPMEPLKTHEQFSVYFNLDNGGGRIRGVYAQENSGAVPIFRAWLAPFADLGAESVTLNPTRGTDHLSFDRVGLPGFQFIQDALGYFPRTHHSNLDVYDHLSIEDLKVSSVILAAFLYHAANRDEKFPRKSLPQAPEPAAADPTPPSAMR